MLPIQQQIHRAPQVSALQRLLVPGQGQPQQMMLNVTHNASNAPHQAQQQTFLIQPRNPAPISGDSMPGSSMGLSQSSTISTVNYSQQSGPCDAMTESLSGSPPSVLTKQRLDDLVREVDPYEQLDDDVKEALLQYTDEFIDSLAEAACQLAKHRKSNILEVKDVQLALERNWNMWIPGFGTEEVRPHKKLCTTEAHKQRMALIKKTLRKI